MRLVMAQVGSSSRDCAVELVLASRQAHVRSGGLLAPVLFQHA